MKPGKSRLWWRRKFTCYIVLLAMLFSMVGGAVNPTPVYADSGTVSDAATSLTIKVGTASSGNPTTVYTTLRTFSDAEMTDRATTQQMYSYFDSMPTPVMDAATGVPLASLLNEVGIDLDDVNRFYFYTTDITTGPYKNMTKAALYDTERYSFPLIGDSWDADESKPAASGTWGDDPTGGKVAVEPMLAVSDNWKRMLSAGVPDFNTQDTSNRYRLMSGQSEAEYLNGTVTASNSAKWICEIDVKLTSASVTGVSLDQSAITLAPGESEQLAAGVTPVYASNPGVSWSSDNPAVATVDSSGLVTAVAGGNATITVTTTDGSFTATCAVTVEAKDPGALTPPALTADTTDNSVGQAVDITFPIDAVWEAAISAVTVNGSPLTVEQYTVAAGDINIAAGVFTAAGDYSIVATATGYADATVTQSMNSVPDTYTVAVDNAIAGGTVTVNPAGGSAGDTITVTVTPDSGKQLVAGSLKYNDGASDIEITAGEGGYSFVLPAADVTVTAQFEDGIYTMWSGDGAQANPYQIKTAADLVALAEYTNTGNTTKGFYWEMENGIDLSGVCSAALGSWTPIGNKQISTTDVVTGYAFLGDFNGNGHSIQNLYVSSLSGYIGLFGAIGGNDNHDGTDGYGVVRNFKLYGSVTNTHDDWQENTFPDFVGGICGVLYAGGTISDVVNYATVQAPCVYNVGGIAGFAGTSVDIGTSMSYARYTNNPSEGNTSILRCVNHGAVGGYNKVGGMAGENASMIKFCYNTGRIDGANASTKNGVGGIVGRNGNNNTACEVGMIDSCYNAGTVGRSAQKWVGGIAGFQNAKSQVSNCYNIGTIIDGAGYNNPIIGQVEGPSINNYSLNTTFASGTSIEETGVRLSEAQFKDTAYTDTSVLPLLGHYFVADTQNLNDGYPVLYWQTGVTLQPLTSIVISVPPTKTAYNATEVFNPEGMKVRGYYGTEIFEMVYSYTYPTDPLTAGANSVTISYNGMEASQPVTVTGKGLTSIAITTAPNQTYYVAGDSFDKAGMVVKATFNESLVETLEPADYTVTPAMLTIDTTEVTVSYTYGDATKTATQPITVMAALPELIDNYYQLEDVTDLLWFADNVTIMGNADINAKLLNDLDLTGIDWVTPIGHLAASSFSGTFDGNNKSITGLVKDNANNYAIFGDARDATIKDLTISVNLTNASMFTAGLISTATNCTVENITVNGSITKTTNSYTAGITSSSKNSRYTNCVNNANLIINSPGGQNAGGIVGYASGTDVLTNCVNNGVITTIAPTAGGIVGTLANTASIMNCHNTAAISGENKTGTPPGGAYNVGGIAGIHSSTGTIANSSNTGAVSTTYPWTNAAYALGGIAGGMTAAGTIDQCYNSGAVTGSLLNVGGVVGYITNGSAAVKNSYNTGDVTSTRDHANISIGGVVGKTNNANITVQNCYNSGSVSVSGTSSNNYAGVIGYAAGIANVSNNYYLDTAADKAIGFNTTYTEANAVSKTSAELQALATALGQYFKPGSLYPILTWQTEDTETFTVTVDDNISGGTITVDPASVIAGDIVTVTVAPAEGKQLAEGSLKYTADGNTYTTITATEGVYSFVMPAADVTVTARFETLSSPKYTVTPVEDVSVYEVGETGGIKTMTAKAGVTGLKYFGTLVTPVVEHEGKEAVVFVHLRNGVQLSINVTRADFDLVGEAQSGFNVEAGDVIKVFIVDDLTNDVDHNPILLQ